MKLFQEQRGSKFVHVCYPWVKDHQDGDVIGGRMFEGDHAQVTCPFCADIINLTAAHQAHYAYSDDKPTTLTLPERHVLAVLQGKESRQPAPGSFITALIEAIIRADGDNTRKLYRVYPEYVQAVESFRQGDLYQRWQAEQAGQPQVGPD